MLDGYDEYNDRALNGFGYLDSTQLHMDTLVIVAREAAEQVLAAMQAHPLGREAAIIGELVEDHPGKVFLRSRIGGMRVVDMISGEQLPRIC